MANENIQKSRRADSIHSHPSNITGLFDLPTEIILQVLKNLDPKDIRVGVKALTRFALTSKRSYALAETAIGCPPRSLLCLTKRFHPSFLTLYSLGLIVSERDDLQPLFPHVSPNDPVPSLDYLKLDGSLSWLVPLELGLDDEPIMWSQNIAPTCRRLKKLVADAERLHLKIPPAFLRFAERSDLQHAVPFLTPTYFTLGHLVECPPDLDRNAGGFLLKFRAEQEDACFWILYLDPMGQHCVLLSTVEPKRSKVHFEDGLKENNLSGAGLSAMEAGPSVTEAGEGIEDDKVRNDGDVDDEDDYDEYLESSDTRDATAMNHANVYILGTDFETYLYHTWIAEAAHFTLARGFDLSETQRHYLEQASQSQNDKAYMD